MGCKLMFLTQSRFVGTPIQIYRNFTSKNVKFSDKISDIFHISAQNIGTPIQIYRNFTSKNVKFSDKISDIFHISAQNIGWGYSLEPPR